MVAKLAIFRCILTAVDEQLLLLASIHSTSRNFQSLCGIFCSIVAICLHCPELVSSVGSGGKVFAISPCGEVLVVLLPDHSCSTGY